MSDLSVNRLIRTSINLSPLAAARRSFGVLLVAGDSNVVSGLERMRTYTDITSVATDFGTSAPEYKAAAAYFGQSPAPQTIMIGRWLRTATAAFLRGGILTTAEQSIASWQAITTGAFTIVIDGVTKNLTALNFSTDTTLNLVAARITTALAGSATVTWNGSSFVVTSATTGATSSVGYATTPVSGTDISGLLKLTQALAYTTVPGYDAETPLQCATAMVNQSSQWYGLTFAASTMPTDSDHQAVAGYIEASTPSHIYGVTITDSRILDSTFTTDLASVLEPLNYKRTVLQYSANAYAICSLIGRAFSVNFDANRSTITLMYKQEPGIAAESLTESQAQTLKTKRCNVFVNYQNGTTIIQYGVMSGQAYFDEIHGLDWLQDAVQSNCYNLLYTSPTKIPQTDPGVNQLIGVIAQAMDQGVNNGLIAPGVWNQAGFGSISTGDFLKDGYYIYAAPLATQSQADRDARKAPPITCAVKLAGAIHEVDIIINVNR